MKNGEVMTRSLRNLVRATTVLYAVLFTILGFVVVDSSNKRADIAQIAEQNRVSLCVFVAYEQAQVDSQQQLLVDNPNVSMVLANFIREGILHRQQALDVLASLEC